MPKSDSDILIKNDVLNQVKSYDIPPPLHMANKASGDNEKELSEEDQKIEPSKSCLGRCLDRHRLELVACLLMFSWYLVQVTSTSMILDKVCLVHYNYSSDICGNLDNYTDIKSEVEHLATNYQLGFSLIQTGPAAVLSCFIGPWSDTYGRKVPVLIAIVGMFLNSVGATVCAYFLHSRVEFYYIPAIFTGCLGGVVTFLTIIYSYASDMTTEEYRTMKYAFVSMAVGLSQPAGTGAGGWIYKFGGYPVVFIVSAVGLAISFILVLFVLPETRGQENNDPLKTKLRNLLTVKTLKESFAATVKQRPNQGRKQILMLIVAMCFIFIASNSAGDINYFYAHHQYNWDNTKYSTFVAIYSIITVALLILVVPALKYIRATDPMLGFIGTISFLLKYIGIGLASKPAIYHVANTLGGLGPCSPLAGRSRISKLVPKEDIGKIFSFVATAESLLPVLTTICVTQVFRAFLKIFPGTPYIMLACCLVPPLCVFGWMTRLPNISKTNEDENKESNGEAYGSLDT